VDTLKREFMALLENQVLEADDCASEVSRMLGAVADGNSPVTVTGGRS
jgi:hypothetical protein